MRPAKELEALVLAALDLSKGTLATDVMATDEAEAEWLRARLKGRHGAKLIGVTMGRPGDERPRLGPWDDSGYPPTNAKPDPRPKKRAAPVLTEDGY